MSSIVHPYNITRHFYTPSMRIEQSLDVYQPIRQRMHEGSIDKDRPVIVLVMGSGWLGHARWIYTMTNWWNASAPQLICGQLGYTCISIRHSGAFLSRGAILLICILMLMLIPFVARLFSCAIILNDGSHSLLLVLGIFSIGVVLIWQGQGAATLDDMIQDVATALHFTQHHSKELRIADSHLVLGGYSSGAHVVAMFLLSKEVLPPNICGILYLSGILSLDSWAMNAVTLSVFGKWSCNVPPPLISDSNPTVTTNRLPPLLPHLIVGCHKELFGIPWLNATFCAKRYQQWLLSTFSSLQQETSTTATNARCVLVHSNHWSVLSSQALAQALSEHLLWFHRP